MALFVAGLTAATLLLDLSLVVAAVYGTLSLVTFLTYARDKASARAGRWRTSEQTLLTLGLLGGWPGAIAAQETLRHKTTKVSFRSRFWVTVVVNLAALGLLLSPLGPVVRDALRDVVGV
ncbi:DUF1294 domain-containing protein [Sanguibacter suaedae]|uniref:DUF1294 domain-containing protein n=1 Tax=Sanguibacter suaedae TaxID=2795737 RepID=UPI0027DD3B48|nr:DUF1294 domain-containing protein [Sanguibacter suaedae]